MASWRHKRAARLADRGCSKKERYASRARATRTMQTIQLERPRAGNDRLNVYRCVTCGCWHVGHRPSKIP